MMRRWFVAVASVAAVSWGGQARAQTSEEFQLWGGWFATGQLDSSTPGARLWLDAHLRRGGAGTVMILRPGVGVALTPWMSLWGGYGWVPTFDDAGTRTDEHRIWQQLILSARLNTGVPAYALLEHAPPPGFVVQSRTRFEQRFHETGHDVALRVREFVRINYKPWSSVPVGVALWDELFVGVGDDDWAVQGFDQNRLFVGPAFYSSSGDYRVEMGYLFVYLRREPVDRIQHVLGLNFLASVSP